MTPHPRDGEVESSDEVEVSAAAKDDTPTVDSVTSLAEPELPPFPKRKRTSWAALLRRVFAHDVFVCQKCGGKRKVLAFLTEREPVVAILAHLGLPTEPPRVTPARAPPQVEMEWDHLDADAAEAAMIEPA